MTPLETISYLLLDAFVVLLAAVIFWYLIRRFASFLTFPFKIMARLKKREEKDPYPRRILQARRIEPKPEESFGMLEETKVLTPFQEFVDWSQYDAPTYLRKNVIVH